MAEWPGRCNVLFNPSTKEWRPLIDRVGMSDEESKHWHLLSVTGEFYDALDLKPEGIPTRGIHTPSESVLSEAKRLVEGGERNQSYGPPEMDFLRIADMATALFEDKLKDDVIFTASDIARFMILLKLSRSRWQMKRDNWVDIAGYAACGQRCETGEW